VLPTGRQRRTECQHHAGPRQTNTLGIFRSGIVHTKSIYLAAVALVLASINCPAGAADERQALLSRLSALLNSSSVANSGKVSMVYIPEKSDVQETGQMIIRALTGAASSKLPVAIVGPDGALNLEIITLATVHCPQGILKGVTVFYLGRDGDGEKLVYLRGKCGADVVFGTYP